jgi:hypothetical protein
VRSLLDRSLRQRVFPQREHSIDNTPTSDGSGDNVGAFEQDVARVTARPSPVQANRPGDSRVASRLDYVR